MDSNIDLNFLILNYESEVLFDLNQIPMIQRNFSNGDEVFSIDHPIEHNSDQNLSPFIN